MNAKRQLTISLAYNSCSQPRHHPSCRLGLAVTERNPACSLLLYHFSQSPTITFPSLNFSPSSLRGASSFVEGISYCKVQPLCNCVSTHVQSREKGGSGEKETQYLAKSIGKSAQVIKPGRGHLTELVEAMPFNSGCILSPKGECRKGWLLKILLSPTTLYSSEVSLSHFKDRHNIFKF